MAKRRDSEGHINTLSKTERAQYADTFAATSSLSNVMASFSRKHDVQHNVQWQRGLQFYLTAFQISMYRAMQSGQFKTLSSAPTDPQKRALKQRNKELSAEITRLEALLAKTETDKESALAEKHEIQIEKQAEAEQKSFQTTGFEVQGA